MVNTLEQYTEGIDLDTVKEDLLEGNGLDMPNIFNAIGNVLFREIKIELKTAVSFPLSPLAHPVGLNTVSTTILSLLITFQAVNLLSRCLAQ